MRWPSKLKLVASDGKGRTVELGSFADHELGAPPGRVPRAPPLTPRPLPPSCRDHPPEAHCRCLVIEISPAPWISKDHREGFFVGLVAGLVLGLGVCIGAIAVLTR